MLSENISMHSMNKYGESGSPCLIPREDLKAYVGLLLRRMNVVLDVTQDIISSIRGGGKLK